MSSIGFVRERRVDEREEVSTPLREARRPLGAEGPQGTVGPAGRPIREGCPPASPKTYGGVDVLGNSKRKPLRRARELGVSGRSRMSKQKLAGAIASRQGQQSRKQR